MRRFTDPLLFFVLTVVAVLTWLIMEWRDAIPEVPEGMMTPMTVAVAAVISVPALVFVTVMALVRSIFNINPKVFWAIMFGGTALASGTVALAGLITRAQGLELGFSTAAWLFAIAALASLIAVVLALTGAIPSPASKQKGSDKPKDSQKSKGSSQSEDRDASQPKGSEKPKAAEQAIEMEAASEVVEAADLSYLSAFDETPADSGDPVEVTETLVGEPGADMQDVADAVQAEVDALEPESNDR